MKLIEIGEDMEKTKEKKKLNPILWFLFAIVFPLIIVLTLTIFILSLANISVLDWVAEKGSNVPVISSVVKTKDEKLTEEKLAESKTKVTEQKEQLSSLTAEVTSLKLSNEELTALLVREKEKFEKLSEEVSVPPQVVEEAEVETGEVAVASFRKMEPASAAKIMEDLDRQSAATILAALSGKVRGVILAEMNPTIAADLTEIILDN